ncbi:hypothetical protein ABH994_006584 [Bradyrhizobium yuanmingense]|uniref:hypothetical protein n=1 Tax=Bradyrhizobium yuanmingense TaxID=108015 RepID=UPI0035161437
MNDDQEDRAIAENYRKDRQAVDAKKAGVEPRSFQQQLQAIEDNQELLLAIARSYGTGEEAPAIAEYMRALAQTSAGSEFDDLNARSILERVIGEVEAACVRKRIPIRGSVAYGVSYEPGATAGQRAVLLTESSIIDASMPFFILCNRIAKQMALTVIIADEDKPLRYSHDPKEVQTHLDQNPDLVVGWEDIFSAFALAKVPQADFTQTLNVPVTAIWAMLLRSIELFAMGHEYGHHVMRHGLSDSSEEKEDVLEEEHEADRFARAASIAMGADESPQNRFAMYGVGAILILGAIDIIRRADALISTGSDVTTPRKRHPSFVARIKEIATLDKQLPEADQKAAAAMRSGFMDIIEIIWDRIKPRLLQLHEEGQRKTAPAFDGSQWLPP